MEKAEREQFAEQMRAKGIAYALGAKPEDVDFDRAPPSLGFRWSLVFLLASRLLKSETGDRASAFITLARRVEAFGGFGMAVLYGENWNLVERVFSERVESLFGVEHVGEEPEIFMPKVDSDPAFFGAKYGRMMSMMIGLEAKPPELLEGLPFTEYPSDGLLCLALGVYLLQLAHRATKPTMPLVELLGEAHEVLASSPQYIKASNEKVAEEMDRIKKREAGRKGGNARHKKADPLKEIAHQAADENPHKSANKLAIDLERQIYEEADRIGYRLSKENTQNTIAKWIREHRKHTPSS